MSALLTALIGAISGFLAGLAKSFIDRRSQGDAALLAKRLKIYADLWGFTGLLPLYPRDPTLTYEKLAARSSELCDWYFSSGGGLFLSRPTQQHYIEFQKALARAIANGCNQPASDDIVRKTDYDMAQAAGSRLRTSLTADLNSRQMWRSV